jgi:hypothetical protein
MPAVPLLVLLLAQAPVPTAPDAPQLDRIREAVAEKPAIAVPSHPIAADTDNKGTPVFRVNVQLWTFKGHAWDKDATIIPDYVRPTMPLAHYEFLKMVTPQDFWESTLYHPIFSVTFDPVVVKNFFKDWHRAVAERNAREEVRRDLQAYLQARTAADR